MFLSSSSTAINSKLDITNAIKGSGTESGVPDAALLIDFTESANRLDADLSSTRKALIEKIGKSAMIDAAITISIFQSLNIAADSSGIKVDDDWVNLAAELAVLTAANEYQTAKNSPQVDAALRGNQHE